MSNWEPEEGSRGCSEHFHNNVFNESNQGLEMIKNETASLVEEDWDWDDLDAPTILKVCRVCLAMDVKMYYMTDYNLQQMYEQATGILLGDDKLPQMFCWECAQRLINGSKLRTKAFKTQILLSEILNSYECITIKHIKSINRAESHLISSLMKTSYYGNDFDVKIVINDDDMHSELGDSRHAFDENIVSQESEEITEKDIQDIEIKDEPICDAYGGDVDLKLSDTAIEPTTREKRILENIEGVDNPERITDKYKTSNVKPHPSMGSLDEFTITRLTYEEPIVVFERLPDLASYINTVRRNEISKANFCDDCEPDEPTSDERIGAPAKRRKVDSTPQKEEQMKVNETIKRSKLLNNATDTSLPNNISNISKDRPTFSNSSSPSSISILNLGIPKTISNMSEGGPNVNSVVTYNKVFLTNNKTITPDVCNSNTENDISKQFPSKCVDVTASCSSLDSKNENYKPNIVNNSKKVKESKHLCHICQKKFTTKSMLNVHTRIHTGDKPYKCDICDYRSPEKGRLTIHIKRKHTKEKNYSCHICQYKSVANRELMMHIRTHTGDKPYKCDICDYRFSNRTYLNRHLQKHTGDEPYKCDICGYRSTNKYNLNRHLRKHTGDKPYICDICDYRSSEKGRITIHVKRKHTKEKNYSCHMCQYKSVANRELMMHIRTHTGDKPYKCDICDFRSSNKTYLNRHLQKHTGDEPYKCDICDYRSTNKNHLNRHLRKHTGDKPYICDICDYRSLEKGGLTIHIKRKHTKEKNYSCHMCQYKSITNLELMMHIRTHTGDKPYICDNCNYRCSRKSDLAIHIKRKHTKEKNHSCHICQYKTVTKGCLNVHLRKHTGDKPYLCDNCNYRCSRKSDLAFHIKRKHAKEKNYSCHICQYKTVTKGSLNVHLRKHTGDKPYICDICDYRCSHSRSLKSHLISKHSN